MQHYSTGYCSVVSSFVITLYFYYLFYYVFSFIFIIFKVFYSFFSIMTLTVIFTIIYCYCNTIQLFPLYILIVLLTLHVLTLHHNRIFREDLPMDIP
jgi:hypothetical protein